MPRVLRSFTWVAFGLACAGWLTASASAAPAGTVVGVSGACFVERAGSRSSLQLGAAVEAADTIDVAADGKLKLRMADGSIVAVAPGTHMALSAYAIAPDGQRQNVQISLPQGLLHAIVAPTRAPAKFEVDTAVGAAAVRSTDWLIEAAANDQQVSVLSGSVVVTSSATGHSVVVPAHATTRVERGRDPLPPHPLTRAAMQRLLGRTEMRRAPLRYQGAVRRRAAAHRPDHRTRPAEHRVSPAERRGAPPPYRRAEPRRQPDRPR